MSVSYAGFVVLIAQDPYHSVFPASSLILYFRGSYACLRTENSYYNEMVVPGVLGFPMLQGSENSSGLLGVCKSTPRPSQCVKKFPIPF